MGATQDESRARTDSVRIKLAPGMVERLERLSIDYGMPVSTMGAFAIAHWVNQQEQNRVNAVNAIEQIARMTGEKIDRVDIEKAISASMPAVAKALNEPLTLDHAEAEASK